MNVVIAPELKFGTLFVRQNKLSAKKRNNKFSTLKFENFYLFFSRVEEMTKLRPVANHFDTWKNVNVLRINIAFPFLLCIAR